MRVLGIVKMSKDKGGGWLKNYYLFLGQRGGRAILLEIFS
jgi:hypothetical protein